MFIYARMYKSPFRTFKIAVNQLCWNRFLLSSSKYLYKFYKNVHFLNMCENDPISPKWFEKLTFGHASSRAAASRVAFSKSLKASDSPNLKTSRKSSQSTSVELQELAELMINFSR